jgi:hypothetical protein
MRYRSAGEVQVALTRRSRAGSDYSGQCRTTEPLTQRASAKRYEGSQATVSIVRNGTMQWTSFKGRMIPSRAMAAPNGWRVVGAIGHMSGNYSTPGIPKGKPIRCFHWKKLGPRRDLCPILLGNNQVNLPPNCSGSATKSPKSPQVTQAKH